MPADEGTVPTGRELSRAETRPAEEPRLHPSLECGRTPQQGPLGGAQLFVSKAEGHPLELCFHFSEQQQSLGVLFLCLKTRYSVNTHLPVPSRQHAEQAPFSDFVTAENGS